MINNARRIAIDAARRRPSVTVVFLSLIVIRVLLMAVPAAFSDLHNVPEPPRSRADDARALTRQLELQRPASPAGM